MNSNFQKWNRPKDLLHIYINVYLQKNINLISHTLMRSNQQFINVTSWQHRTNSAQVSELQNSIASCELQFLSPISINWLIQLTWLPSKIHHFSSSLALDASLWVQRKTSGNSKSRPCRVIRSPIRSPRFKAICRLTCQLVEFTFLIDRLTSARRLQRQSTAQTSGTERNCTGQVRRDDDDIGFAPPSFSKVSHRGGCVNRDFRIPELLTGCS